MLSDDDFAPTRRISAPAETDGRDAIKLYDQQELQTQTLIAVDRHLVFPCAVIRGSLAALGMPVFVEFQAAHPKCTEGSLADGVYLMCMYRLFYINCATPPIMSVSVVAVCRRSADRLHNALRPCSEALHGIPSKVFASDQRKEARGWIPTLQGCTVPFSPVLQVGRGTPNQGP